MTAKSHWDRVHESKGPEDVSWYEARPAASMDLIAACGHSNTARVIDVGGGISPLVDHLLDLGYPMPTVLDISASALAVAQQRLGERRHRVRWVVSDVAHASFDQAFDIWHERAVFHFLVDPSARARHIDKLRSSLAPDGHAIIATFAEDGPEQCSGLPVMRYSPEALAEQLGDDFRLIESRRATHRTPWGSEQRFIYGLFRKTP